MKDGLRNLKLNNLTIENIKYTLISILYLLFLSVVLSSCSESQKHTAPAISQRDSVSVMTTYGVNTLISDSGVIKYRLITEEWDVNENKKPSRWTFNKGILLTQFNLRKHVVGYIQCDTAIYYDKVRKWVLRGRVRIHTSKGIEFYSPELYWDEQNHKIWSYKYSHIKTPTMELEGNRFTSTEDMSEYEVFKTKGWTLYRDSESSSNMFSDNTAPIDSTVTVDKFKGLKLLKR